MGMGPAQPSPCPLLWEEKGADDSGGGGAGYRPVH